MNDLDKLKALLNDFGVEFYEYSHNHRIHVDCNEGAEKIGGYASFFTRFEFDENCNFIKMGAYE